MRDDLTDLERLVHSVCDDPFFVAFHLRRYAARHALDNAAMGQRLGCTREQLTHLGLCRASTDRQDLLRIAEHCGADVEALAEIMAPAWPDPRCSERD